MESPKTDEIRALRTSAGLTQTQFGALLYCALRTVQDWEGGQAKMPPGLWELARIKHDRLLTLALDKYRSLYSSLYGVAPHTDRAGDVVWLDKVGPYNLDALNAAVQDLELKMAGKKPL